jgi:hypothetical protein
METNILPKDVMQGIFDIVKKGEKLYVVLKEEDTSAENKVKELLGEDDIEFLDLFDLIHEHILKDLCDSTSIFDSEPLLEKLGFRRFTEIFYDLTKLEQTKKVLFNYALLGRRGNAGMLQNLEGRRLSKSVIVLPSENEKEVEAFIKKWNVKYNKRQILRFLEE